MQPDLHLMSFFHLFDTKKHALSLRNAAHSLAPPGVPDRGCVCTRTWQCHYNCALAARGIQQNAVRGIPKGMLSQRKKKLNEVKMMRRIATHQYNKVIRLMLPGQGGKRNTHNRRS